MGRELFFYKYIEQQQDKFFPNKTRYTHIHSHRHLQLGYNDQSTTQLTEKQQVIWAGSFRKEKGRKRSPIQMKKPENYQPVTLPSHVQYTKICKKNVYNMNNSFLFYIRMTLSGLCKKVNHMLCFRYMATWIYVCVLCMQYHRSKVPVVLKISIAMIQLQVNKTVLIFTSTV